MSEVNAEKVVCKQCETEFIISEEQIQWFLDKGLEPPKRCQKCRDDNKLNQKIRDVATKVVNELVLNK